jgi:CBS domain-containing membrane protein
MSDSSLTEWVKSFAPVPLASSPRERLRAALGVCIAITLTLGTSLWLFGPDNALRVAPPLGASSLLLFAASSSPFAQPWPVLAGSLLCSLLGVLLGLSGLEPLPTAALGAGLALLGMSALRCLHPPSSALTLIVALCWPAYRDQPLALLYPIACHCLLLVCIALIYNNLTGHPYPKARPPRENPHGTRDPLPGERLSFTKADIDAALAEFDEYLDITREDLERLLKQTERHAFRRSLGEITAADIMSRDLRWATPDTPIEQAWETLRGHRLRNLPVVEGTSRQLLGIVTPLDLLGHFRPGKTRWCFEGLRLRRGNQQLRAIMSTPVTSVPEGTHLSELVPLLSDRGLHCLPVVDANGRLTGMIGQSDLIAALYRIWLQHPAG